MKYTLIALLLALGTSLSGQLTEIPLPEHTEYARVAYFVTYNGQPSNSIQMLIVGMAEAGTVKARTMYSEQEFTKYTATAYRDDSTIFHFDNGHAKLYLMFDNATKKLKQIGFSEYEFRKTECYWFN